MPTFSVILPTKNREALAIHAINSVLNQKFDDYELIISDNSDDLNASRVEEFCNLNSSKKIKFYKTRNLSMVDNWNYALNKASGQNLIMIEDKMVLYSDALSTIYNSLSKSKSGIVYWNYDNINDSDKYLTLIRKAHYTPELVRAEFKLNLIQRNISREVFTMPRGLCCSVPRNLVDLVKSTFNAEFFEDTAPDMTSGFKLLHSVDEYWDCGESLVVVTSSRIGNGKEIFEKQKNDRFIYMMGKSGKKIELKHVESNHFSLTNIIINDYNMVASRKDGAEIIQGRLYWRNIIKEMLNNFVNSRFRNKVAADISIITTCKLNYATLLYITTFLVLEMTIRKIRSGFKYKFSSQTNIVNLEMLYKN
jgi:glycosyltransferase involved in cell wall biosynthesis